MLGILVRLRNWMDSDSGATATEYGILVAVIAFVLIVGAAAFGDALDAYFDKLGGVIDGWSPAASI